MVKIARDREAAGSNPDSDRNFISSLLGVRVVDSTSSPSDMEGGEGGGWGERKTDRQNVNTFYKDCSLGSFRHNVN